MTKLGWFLFVSGIATGVYWVAAMFINDPLSGKTPAETHGLYALSVFFSMLYSFISLMLIYFSSLGHK